MAYTVPLFVLVHRALRAKDRKLFSSTYISLLPVESGILSITSIILVIQRRRATAPFFIL